MPLAREQLDRVVAALNAGRPLEHAIEVVSFGKGTFELSFADVPLGDASCVDEHFTDVQFALSVHEKVDTSVVGAKHDESARRYLVAYEVIEWDA